MKNINAILVGIIGVVCIVFGVLFIMEANSSRDTVANELKASGLTIATVDAAYDQAKAGLAQATIANSVEGMQSAGWQKASLGLAKSNIGTINFVQNSGILNIVIGAGLLLTGMGLMKKTNA